MDHVALADQRPARVATGPFTGSAGGGRIARALQLGLDILGASLELGEWELWKMCMQEPILCEVTERNPEHIRDFAPQARAKEGAYEAR